jgi:hypothetical protein
MMMKNLLFIHKVIILVTDFNSDLRIESGTSTDPVEIIKGIIKKIPKYWVSKIGVKKLIKSLPIFKEPLEIPDSDEINSWIEGICQTPHRRPGTLEGHKGEEWVLNQFKELGLEQITKDPIPINLWKAERWSLRVNDQEIPSFYVVNCGFTKSQGIIAPLIYVGKGRAKDFKKLNVNGKIVVADVPFPFIPMGLLFNFLKLLRGVYHISNPDYSLTFLKKNYINFVRQNFMGGTTLETAADNDVYWNAVKGGAKAICLILKDQPSNSNSHYGPYDGIMKPIPGVWIGKYDGINLRNEAKKQAQATLILEGTIKDGEMSNIWGVLPGVTNEIVMVTSHHDAPFKGAIEDGAGVAQVLAQASIWKKVPKEKRKRTMVFVIDAGHFYGSLGAIKFPKDHKEIMKKVKILITLEHLGAREVKEVNKKYVETNQLAYTCMFTSTNPLTIATVTNALIKKPARTTISIPLNLLADVPTSDAAGFALESNASIISWIGCPYYLLDEYDTMDKVAKSELKPICETVTEMIKPYMA